MIGLPSLHTLDGTQKTRIWLAVESTDMRCGFDRLAERVRAVISQDPLGDSLFIFRSRRGDRLKILTWDRDGFVLWYKRLEAGVFKLPRVSPGSRSVELRASELAMILGWHRHDEAEASSALRTNHGKQQGKGRWVSYPQEVMA